MTTNAAVRPPAGEACRFWRRVVGDFEFEDGVALTLLEQAAAALDLVDACGREIHKDGLTLPGSRRGTRRAHPLLAVQAEGRRQFLAALRALRLDVSEAG